MNLKAGAQSIGLETNSLGWEILEKLVAEHDNNPEWADIWNATTAGKVTRRISLPDTTLSYMLCVS
jgi:hypothetical protein